MLLSWFLSWSINCDDLLSLLLAMASRNSAWAVRLLHGVARCAAAKLKDRVEKSDFRGGFAVRRLPGARAY